MVLGQSSNAAVNGWVRVILQDQQQVEGLTKEILPIRGLIEVLGSKLITGKTTLHVSMARLVIIVDPLLPTAG
jgi:hypothetical protein